MGPQEKKNRPLTLINLGSGHFNGGDGQGRLNYIGRKCAKWHPYGEPSTLLTVI